VMMRLGRSSMAVGAPFGDAPAPRVAPAVAMQAGLLLQETNRCERLWCGGSTVAATMVKNSSVWGQIRTGKASIYRGFQSYCSLGQLWPNLSLNRLEITLLEIGFKRDQNKLNQRTQFSVGYGSGVPTRRSDNHGATQPTHGPLGPCAGGEAGWIRLASGLDWVSAQSYRKEFKNLFSFLDAFIKQTGF
jgi:hypothetical protein